MAQKITPGTLILSLTLIAVLLTACTASAPAAPSTLAQTSAQTPSPALPVEPTPSQETLASNAPTPPAPEITAEPLPYDPERTHLPPEEWRDWPIVPQMTERARVIYQRGLALGNDPHAFSKVGDCQSIKEVLLGIYDQPGNYILRPSQIALQDTIDQFQGSFNRDGMAVKGGFNAASVLSPLWADPQACLAGETPLECEIRIHKPSFMIISLEVWWEGRSVERYEAYMRQIIEYALAHGTVPILSTKADNVEGDHSINLATARLAYEYDLPLWNFWLAAQGLPNRGLDPNRPDGFHLSQRAWTERSYTALATLDALWRSVKEEDPAAVALSPAPTQTISTLDLPDSLIQPQELQTAPSGSELLAFGLAERQGESQHHAGVFLFDLTSQRLRRLLPDGYDLQDVSPDGRTLLVNQGSQLFLVRLPSLSQTPVSDVLHPYPSQASALWLPDGKGFVLLTAQKGQRQLSLVDYTQEIVPPANDWQPITSSPENPIGLITTASPGQIVWEDGECSPDGDCIANGLWASALDGQSRQPLPEPGHPYYAADGRVAYGTREFRLIVNDPDGSLGRELPLPGTAKWDRYLTNAAWDFSGERLVLQVTERSNYSGKRFQARNYLLTPANWSIQELADSTSLNSSLLWTPDENGLLLAGTTASENGYALNLSRLALPEKTLTSYQEALGISAPDYVFITRMGWVHTK